MATTKKTTPKKTTKTTAKKAAAKPVAKKVTAKTAAKTTAKTAAAAKPVKKPAAKKAAPKKVDALVEGGTQINTGLHYDKSILLTEYNNTFHSMMKLTALSIGGVLLYFFIMVTFLGGFSMTKTDPFAKKFSDRIDLGASYDGLKLPIYQTEE